jgi:hypothetical protein
MSGWHDWNLGFNSHKQFNPMEKEKLRRGTGTVPFQYVPGKWRQIADSKSRTRDLALRAPESTAI